MKLVLSKVRLHPRPPTTCLDGGGDAYMYTKRAVSKVVVPKLMPADNTVAVNAVEVVTAVFQGRKAIMTVATEKKLSRQS